MIRGSCLLRQDIEVHCSIVWSKRASRPTNCSTLCGPIRCTIVPSRSGIGSSSISGIWKPSIGTCCGRSSELEAVRCRSSISCSRSASIRWTAACRRISLPIGPRSTQVRALSARGFARALDAVLGRRCSRDAAEHGDRTSADACRDAGVHAASVAARKEDPPVAGAMCRSAVSRGLRSIEIPDGCVTLGLSRDDPRTSAGTTSTKLTR